MSSSESDAVSPESKPAESAAPAMRGFVRQASLVGGLTLGSRVLGFVRDWLLVALFTPARWVSDVFLFAETIPNLFRALLGEGALSASFIPAFVRARENETPESASRMAGSAATLLAGVTGALVVIGVLGCLAADWLIAPAAKPSLTLKLTAAMLPFMAFVCLAALMGGMLQSCKRFALPAFYSVVLNLCLLGGFGYVYWVVCDGDPSRLALPPRAEEGLYKGIEGTPAVRATFALAASVVLAGVIQVVLAWPKLWSLGVKLRPVFSFDHPGVKATIKAMGPTTLGLGVVQLNVLIDRLIAYFLPEGAITNLYMGNRLMNLPLALFGLAIASTAFPYFAGHVARGDHEGLWKRLVKTIRMTWLVTLPAAFGLVAMADPIIRLLFQRPDLALDHPDVYRMASATAYYALGLGFFSVNHLLTRTFYALGDYATPVKIAAGMVGLNLILNLTLIFMPDPWRAMDNTYHGRIENARDARDRRASWFYETTNTNYYRTWGLTEASFPAMGRFGGGRMAEAGLALATTLSAAGSTLLLARALRRRLKPLVGDAAWREGGEELSRSLWPVLLDSAATGLLAYWFRQSIPYEPEWPALLERVAAPIVLGVLAYWIIGGVIPLREFEEWRAARAAAKAQKNQPPAPPPA